MMGKGVWFLWKAAVWLRCIAWVLLFSAYFASVVGAFVEMGYKVGLVVVVPLLGQVVWFFIAWVKFGFWNDYTCWLIFVGFVKLLHVAALRSAVYFTLRRREDLAMEISRYSMGDTPTLNIKPKWIGWMPSPLPPDETPALNPWPEARQIVGAVRVPPGQELPDEPMYLEYLADRVQEMIEREEDPKAALAELVHNLESEGLLGVMPQIQRWSEVGHDLIVENPALHMRLGAMEVPGELPERITVNDPRALRYVEETCLEAWTTALLNRPAEIDR
jgi:hypothetical protein